MVGHMLWDIGQQAYQTMRDLTRFAHYKTEAVQCSLARRERTTPSVYRRATGQLRPCCNTERLRQQRATKH